MHRICPVIVAVSLGATASSAAWHADDSVLASGGGKTWEGAFKTIQEGINATSNRDVVIAAEGTYVENMDFEGENIVLTSTNSQNSVVVGNTITDENDSIYLNLSGRNQCFRGINSPFHLMRRRLRQHSKRFCVRFQWVCTLGRLVVLKGTRKCLRFSGSGNGAS